MNRTVVAAMLGWLFSAGSGFAEAMRLDDLQPRWVYVQFEVSPSDKPGQLDSVYTPNALAWFEPGDELGQVRVTVPGRAVEQHLLAKQNPKAGSFSNFVWIFESDTGRVRSATLSGTLIRRLQWGFFEPTVETDIRTEMFTDSTAGYRKPKRILGQAVFRFCTEPVSKGCTVVQPTTFDTQRGYVNAVGGLFARSGIFTARTFSPLGEAVFTELPSHSRARDTMSRAGGAQ